MTSKGSPVNKDSSTVDSPVRTVPSTGMRSPGRTKITSPTTTLLTATSLSRPSYTTQAVVGDVILVRPGERIPT